MGWSMGSDFHRYVAGMERSFALRKLNAHETELNEHFWSFKVISDYSRFVANDVKRIDPEKPTIDVFHASGPDARRIPPTVTDWLSARDELENWLRCAALVSAAAFHEAYLRQIVRSALMSDPLVRYGLARRIDGAALLKEDKELEFKEEIKAITRGDWSERQAAFHKLFGTTQAACFPVRDLEAIRKLRNNFAHGFGRDLEVPEPSNFADVTAQRLSQATFISYIKLMSKSAAAIDKHLLNGFIGSFELIHHYHKWRKLERAPKHKDWPEGRAFQQFLTGTCNVAKSTEYCEQLIAFYDAL